MQRKGIGTGGLFAGLVLMAAMCTGIYLKLSPDRLEGRLGLCLPSPNMWNIPGEVSWWVNIAVILATATSAYFVNKHFNFLRSTDTVFPTAFLVLTASNPWLMQYLNSGTLICAVNAMMIPVVFNAYHKENATQDIFTVASFLSLGSMIQYAFIPYIFAYIGAAVLMKAFRLKEFAALILGLAAPYWVGIGLGLVDISAFRIPQFTNLFIGYALPSELVMLMANIGLTVLWVSLTTLNATIRLYAGNSRTLALNSTITFVGMASVLGIVLDFNNMLAYLMTLYYTAAATLANAISLWPPRHPAIILGMMASVYLFLYFGMIFV